MCNRTDPASPAGRCDQTELDFPAIARGDRQAFAGFCRYFYDPTFTVIARFAGIADTDVLCLLTETVFLQLWGDRELFLQYNGGILFRITMQVTISYLDENGNNARAREIESVISAERIFRAIEKQSQNGSQSNKGGPLQ